MDYYKETQNLIDQNKRLIKRIQDLEDCCEGFRQQFEGVFDAFDNIEKRLLKSNVRCTDAFLVGKDFMPRPLPTNLTEEEAGSIWEEAVKKLKGQKKGFFWDIMISFAKIQARKLARWKRKMELLAIEEKKQNGI